MQRDNPKNPRCKMVENPLATLFSILKPDNPPEEFLLGFSYRIATLQPIVYNGYNWGNAFFACYCKARRVLDFEGLEDLVIYQKFHEQVETCFAELLPDISVRTSAWDTWRNLLREDPLEKRFSFLRPSSAQFGSENHHIDLHLAQQLLAQVSNLQPREQITFNLGNLGKNQTGFDKKKRGGHKEQQ